MSMKPTDANALTELIKSLDDPNATRVLMAVTKPRLRDAGDLPAWTPQLARALATELEVTPDTDAAAPAELARRTLLLLAQDPAYVEPIAALIRNPAPQRFMLDPITGTLLVTAAVFALQSHIDFQRDKDGKWSFKFKKTPTKDGLVTQLIKKLVALLSGGPPATP